MKRLPLYTSTPVAAAEAEEGLDRNPDCTRCALSHGVQTPCMGADGEAGGLLVIGDSPLVRDDKAGRPFTGPGGVLLREAVKAHWKGPVAYTNALLCAPGSRDIKDKHITQCRPYLSAVLKEVRPQRIIVLGSQAAHALLGRPVGVSSARGGWTYIHKTSDAPVPVYFTLSPQTAARNRFYRDLFTRDLEAALRSPAPEQPPLEGEVRVVETEADSRQAVAELRAARWGTFDVETAGRMHNSSFRLLCLSAAPSGTNYAWLWDGEVLKQEAIRRPLVEWLQDSKAPKLGANVKYDIRAVKLTLGAKVRGICGDARLWRKLENSDASGYLDDMMELVGMGGAKAEAAKVKFAAVQKLVAGVEAENMIKRREESDAAQVAAGLKPRKWPALHSSRVEGLEALAAIDAEDAVLGQYIRNNVDADNRGSWEYAVVDQDILWRYNARDAVGTDKVALWADQRVSQNKGLVRIRDAIVNKVASRLARVEEWGIGADPAAMLVFDGELAKDLEAPEKMIAEHPMTGPTFNVRSVPQLKELLFEKLKFEPFKKTDKGNDSTDGEVLDRYAEKHPIVKAIKDVRHLRHLRSTYGAALIPLICEDGRIHPSILPDGAGCLPAGELMLTHRGYLRAEDVRVGDKVLTHEGRVRQIDAVFKNPPRPIYRVRLESGLELRTTDNHEFWTARGWVRADALAIGDEAYVHSEAESWRPVEGWPYLVSSWGRVRHQKSEQILALQPKGHWGHLKVTLVRDDQSRVNGNRKDFAVHRLVANAFLGAHPDLEVRHLSGVAWDNSVTNLAWGTTVENRADGKRHGSYIGNGRLTTKQVEEIRRVPKVRSKQARGDGADSALAQRFGISREHVRDIRNGKRRVDLRTQPEERRYEYITSRVVSISVEAAEVNYGVSVREDHSHVTSGIVTHNTGRTSMSDPNLQNQVSEKRDPKYGKLARDCFVTKPGRKFVSLDYSQIELRVAAMISGDQAMVDAFTSGEDFHMRTAKQISKLAWGISPDQVTKQHRAVAKNINFACVTYDTKILTRTGWKTCDELQVGDETVGRTGWVKVTGKVEYDDAELVEWEGFKVTPDHRWWSRHKVQGQPNVRRTVEEFTTLRDLKCNTDIVLATGEANGVGCELTPAECGVLGWLVTDGHVNDKSAFIHQSRVKNPHKLAEIEQLLTDAGVRFWRYDRPEGITELRLKDPKGVWRARAQRVDEAFVLTLNKQQRAAFVRAGLLAEGWQTLLRSGKRGRWHFAQNPGRVADAFRLAFYLDGHFVRQLERFGYGKYADHKNLVMTLSKPHITDQRIRSKILPGGRAPVWCVQTEDGSWTMRRGDRIALTGNCLYNAGPGRVAAMIREQGFPCTRTEAERAMDLIAGEFKGFARWRDARIDEVKRIARVTTYWDGVQPARVRHLHKAGDPDEYVRQNAINGGVNMPIQGTASDYLMASLCEVVDWIDGEGIEDDVKLCIPVHDQLLFDVADHMVEETIHVAREIMTGWPPVGASVPLVVDAEIGTAWGSLVPWKEAA